MVTGIDESGNFSSDSKLLNFFVAVHIDQNQNKYETKKEQYLAWEATIPDDKKDKKGEIKGQRLTDNFLYDFYEKVISPDPKILISVVRIIPAENPVEILEKHKQYEINQFQNMIDKAILSGHESWAKGYKDILAWYQNKNYNLVLKIKCLERLLTLSINRVLGWGQLSFILDKGDEKNIRDISFKIDKDIVKSVSTQVLWNEIFRQYWQQISKTEPIELIDKWSENEHPVLKYYAGKDNSLNLKKVMKKNTHFMNSNESWEIRMADLIGTILHRGNNANRCVDICQELEKKLGGKQKNYFHLILNDIP